MTDPMQQLHEDFDRILGDAWQPTMPAKPEPMPSPDATPVAVWPPKEGVEL